MLPTPCYVISDAHLGVRTPREEHDILDLLRSVAKQGRSLLLNGDLFDFWFEWRSVIPREHFRVLAALADLREAGVPVVMVAGNHDCWGGDVLRRDVGVEYHIGAWEGRIGDWRVRADHGDGLRPLEDRGYRRLRAVLRHPWTVKGFRILHPDLGSWIAKRTSRTSRTHRASDGGTGLRDVAHTTLAARPDLDLLVLGHAHFPALERAPGGGIYANAGGWLAESTFLLVQGDRVELRRWRGSTESECLDSLDRRSEKIPT